MMIRSFFAVQALNPFVKPESIFTARIQLPEGAGETYEKPLARQQFYEKLVPATTTVCAPSGTIDVIFTCDSRSGARVLHVSPPFVVL